MNEDYNQYYIITLMEGDNLEEQTITCSEITARYSYKYYAGLYGLEELTEKNTKINHQNTAISIESYNIEEPNFLDDEEKMIDMKILTDEEFLFSYSYLTEEEYYNTEKWLPGNTVYVITLKRKTVMTNFVFHTKNEAICHYLKLMKCILKENNGHDNEDNDFYENVAVMMNSPYGSGNTFWGDSVTAGDNTVYFRTLKIKY